MANHGNDAGSGSLLALGAGSIDIIYHQLQNQGFETIILAAALNFLTKILNTFPSSFLDLQKNEKFYQILKSGLIDISQKKIQDKIEIFSMNLCTKIEQLMIAYLKSQTNLPNKGQGGQATAVELPSSFVTQVPSYLILETAIKVFMPLSLKEQNSQKMRTLYKLMNQIFSETEVYRSLDKIEAPQFLVENLMKMIYEREIREGTSRDEDVVLAGLFDFLGKLLVRFPIVRQKLPEKKKFIQFLTHQGLFKKEKRMITQQAQGDERAQKNLPPMCKNPTTRNSCLELLRILCLDDLQDKLYVT